MFYYMTLRVNILSNISTLNDTMKRGGVAVPLKIRVRSPLKREKMVEIPEKEILNNPLKIRHYFLTLKFFKDFKFLFGNR